MVTVLVEFGGGGGATAAPVAQRIFEAFQRGARSEMMIDRRLIQEIDWVLLGLVLLQALVGVLFIYSSSHFLPGGFHVRQLVWIGVSLARPSSSS
ncbi:MAG: hypothetical protein M0C28_04280 [Candidatus Moduliflexus flocculans]|nr:hypothetical protein [Candidatus Moduliflexus flocculans]